MDNLKKLFSYIESFTNLEKTQKYTKRYYKLDRMYILLDLFQNPQADFRTIHVAGTKGKSSTAAFIASVLTARGQRTGLFTSPHVTTYCERITVDNKFPEVKLLLSIGEKIKAGISKFSGFSPTTFELLTLLAFCYFRDTGCKYGVIEVGIGGRLDATNVISPEACVITPIGIEHTDVLGKTITKIAKEKAGIIKQNSQVFSGYQVKPVKKVLARVSESKNTGITFLDETVEILTTETTPAATSCRLRLKGQKEISFSLVMPGDFQAENAALAFITLISIFPQISYNEIKTGFKNTKLPGRMEIVRQHPLIVFDGAHTPLAVRRILTSFTKLSSEKGILLFGSVKGKDFVTMSEILAPAFGIIIISTPGFFKESDPAAIYKTFKKQNNNTILEKHPQKAYEKAISLSEGKLPILVTGSFYMIAEMKKFSGNYFEKKQFIK